MVWQVTSFTSGVVLESSDTNTLQDNFHAVAEADSGAPSIYGDAWTTSFSDYGQVSLIGGPWTPSSGFYFITGNAGLQIFIGGAWRQTPYSNGFNGHGLVLTDGSKLRFDATGSNLLYWRRLIGV